ncbi:response regulator transcription factor [soil metagenome]
MRIILCDDHPIVVMATSMLLEASGHAIAATTQDPAALVGLVEQHRPDACLVDLHFEDPERARNLLPSIARIAGRTDVVAYSGTADAEHRIAALRAGAVAVASKAMSGQDLVALVEGRSSGDDPRMTTTPDGEHHLLTPRELQVLQCLIHGDTTARIAGRLGLRQPTVLSHMQSIMAKLGTHSRSATIVAGVRLGLVTLTA